MLKHPSRNSDSAKLANPTVCINLDIAEPDTLLTDQKFINVCRVNNITYHVLKLEGPAGGNLLMRFYAPSKMAIGALLRWYEPKDSDMREILLSQTLKIVNTSPL